MWCSCFCVLPGSAEALVRCAGKIKYILIAYCLCNIFAKNCRNRTVYVKIIASCKGGTFFLRHSVDWYLSAVATAVFYHINAMCLTQGQLRRMLPNRARFDVTKKPQSSFSNLFHMFNATWVCCRYWVWVLKQCKIFFEEKLWRAAVVEPVNIQHFSVVLVSPDGVAPSRMVSVSACVNLPLHHKSRSSLLALAHPGGPGKRAIKRFWWFR